MADIVKQDIDWQEIEDEVRASVPDFGQVKPGFSPVPIQEALTLANWLVEQRRSAEAWAVLRTISGKDHILQTFQQRQDQARGGEGVKRGDS